MAKIISDQTIKEISRLNVDLEREGVQLPWAVYNEHRKPDKITGRSKCKL